MKKIINKGFSLLGYRIESDRKNDEMLASDLSSDELKIYETVKPFTMTSLERVVSVIQATEYIVANDLAGDFVECGVWQGGSMMAACLTLLKLGISDRRFYLYDTFTGMSEPTAEDVQYDGESAAALMNATETGAENWCYADLESVTANLKSTGYPMDKIHLIKGKVEDTIPETLPSQIAMLRLDTDWYESTRHELTHLYPNLVKNGILIIDDYGHWKGSKQATDEYFEKLKFKPYLQRVDYTGRIAVKTEK